MLVPFSAVEANAIVVVVLLHDKPTIQALKAEAKMNMREAVPHFSLDGPHKSHIPGGRAEAHW